MSEFAEDFEFPGPLVQAVQRVEEELQHRGFGVLATLPVHEILQEKIGARIEPLVILEVCSPRHADRALAISREVALLLPCKIVLFRQQDRTRISLLRPTTAIGAFLPLQRLRVLAEEVEVELRSALTAAITPRNG